MSRENFGSVVSYVAEIFSLSARVALSVSSTAVSTGLSPWTESDLIALRSLFPDSRSWSVTEETTVSVIWTVLDDLYVSGSAFFVLLVSISGENIFSLLSSSWSWWPVTVWSHSLFWSKIFLKFEYSRTLFLGKREGNCYRFLTLKCAEQWTKIEIDQHTNAKEGCLLVLKSPSILEVCDQSEQRFYVWHIAEKFWTFHRYNTSKHKIRAGMLTTVIEWVWRGELRPLQGEETCLLLPGKRRLLSHISNFPL